MQVTLDVSPTAQRHAGLGRYAGEVAQVLGRRQDIALTLFYNREGQAQLPDNLNHLPQKTVNMGNKPWRMAVLLSQLTHWPLDKVFGPGQIFHATNHLLAHFSRARTVYTMHDLIFLHYPEYHLPRNRWYLTFAMPRYLRAADMVVTPSECSRRDAIRFYGLPAEKIQVICEAAGSQFQPATDLAELARVRHKYHLPQQFLLHVGTIEPRKNLIRLLDALQALLLDWPELKLVLVGQKGWLYDDFFGRLLRLGLQDKVIFPGYVAEADLPAFYQLARVFVFPSLFEGFGLPVLEAMACGTPVVCSNTSSLPEVAGRAGLLVDPTDTTALTVAINRLLSDAELQTELKGRSLLQAQKFSWETAAETLVALYRRLLAPAGNSQKGQPA